MTLKEKEIERNICYYAKSHQWLVFKFTGHKGVPDRILLKRGTTLFMEFKSKNKKPTKIQNYMIKLLENQKFKVFIIDNIEKGKKVIDSYGWT